MKNFWKYILVAIGVATLACNSGKAPAEAALKLADDAVNAARPAAEKYVPEEFKALADELAAAKEAFGKGDYKGALAAAQSIPTAATELLGKAKAKKEELVAAWNQMSGSLPQMVDAIKTRIETLSKTKKLPAGIDAGRTPSRLAI